MDTMDKMDEHVRNAHDTKTFPSFQSVGADGFKEIGPKQA